MRAAVSLGLGPGRGVGLGLVLVLALALGLGAAASSCAHAVRIISVPEGATVAVDGKVLGRAPLLYQERSGPPGMSTAVRAELAGYGVVARRESHRICPNSANLILDSLGVGFLFGFCMRDEYVYDFTVAAAQAGAGAGAGAAPSTRSAPGSSPDRNR